MQTKHPHNQQQTPSIVRRAMNLSGKLALCSSIASALFCAEAKAERNYISWAQRFDPNSGVTQSGVAVTTDRRGNVISTGYTTIGNDRVYYTAKYDGLTGALVWDEIFDAGFGDNEPVAVATDSLGNVIVTGRSVGNGTNEDYLTIKYAALDGQQMWTQRYNKVGTNGADVPVAMVVDVNDNVIITGRSVQSGQNNDILTIKYNEDGEYQWETRYNSVGNYSDVPAGLAVMENGAGIAVTGVSRVGANTCFFTAKYNSSGGVVWEKTYDGPGNRDDSGKAVAFGPDGTVYMTGTRIENDGTYSFHTIKYESISGSVDWSQTYQNSYGNNKDVVGIAVDRDGNAFITGTAVIDGFNQVIYTAKYSDDEAEEGAVKWERDTKAPDILPNQTDSSTATAVGIKLDGGGNPVVAGTSRINIDSDDYYAVKYDSATGATLSERRIDGDRVDGTDTLKAFELDRAGNLALIGTSQKPAPSSTFQMLTVKVNRFLLANGDPISGFDLSDKAVITGFNTAALADNGTIATQVKVKDGKKVYSGILKQAGGGGNLLTALQGEPAPDVNGAVFKSFSDPVVAPNGRHAFIGKLAGVPGSEAGGVWTDALNVNATLQCALQLGKQVPGAPMGVLVKSISSISLRNGHLVALITVKGTGITGANSTMLVGLSAVGNGVDLLRTGDAITADGEQSTIKKLSVYNPAKSSPGHGRYHADGEVVAAATLADKRTVLLTVASNGTITPLLATGGAADTVVTGATYRSFGAPTVGSSGFYYAALATLNKGGEVGAGNDTAIVASLSGVGFSDIAIEGGPAFDVTGATFTGFSDPVSSNFGRYAFFGTMKGTGVNGGNKQGLWFGTSGALDLVARTGEKAPDALGIDQTEVFQSFTNLGLPGGAATAGPIFLAKVKGKGVNAKNNSGLWGTDSYGILRQLLRNGDQLGDYTVKKFVMLNSANGAFSVSRTFNNTGGATAMVSFTDKTQALIYVAIP